MNIKWSKLIWTLVATTMVVSVVDAQTKKRTVSTKKTTSKSTPKPPANQTATQVLDASAAAQVDTVKPPPPPPVKDPFAFDSVKVSLRSDAAIERNLVKSRTPLPYEHIREDDAWYRERVWREIDIREKMNLI